MGSLCIGTSEVVCAEVELTLINFLPRQARTDFYFGVILPSVTYVIKYFSQIWNLYMKERQKTIYNLDWCTPGKVVPATTKWNNFS